MEKERGASTYIATVGAMKQGKRKRGRPTLTFVDQLRKDTGLSTDELKTCMNDREEWKKIVVNVVKLSQV